MVFLKKHIYLEKGDLHEGFGNLSEQKEQNSPVLKSV